MFGDTPLIMVEDAEELRRVAAILDRASVIGVDTESDSFYSYTEKVCLLQISDSEADYIIDPLRVRDLSPLAPIMADPSVVKILHGADYDVVCLKRDYGFEFHNLFDTLIAAQLLGAPRVGLGDLINDNFGIKLDKLYQRHNWSLRPLREEHLEYARGDTHWLLALRELMLRKLRRSHRVRHLKEECGLIEKREWKGRTFDSDGYLDIKQSGGLSDTGKRVLRRLYLYRNGQAEKMNRPTFKVIPDTVLVRLAEKQPTGTRELDRAIPSKSAMKRRHAAGLLDAVREGLEDDFEIPARRKPKKGRRKPAGSRPRLRGRAAEKAMADLKAWRNDLIQSGRGYTPFTTASNTVLKAIASSRPTTLEELSEVPDVRRWQVRDFGDEFLAILDKVDPND
ncbi:MAG: ribonuclease D [Myxococcota bacterium]|jgi:ribonuclease D